MRVRRDARTEAVTPWLLRPSRPNPDENRLGNQREFVDKSQMVAAHGAVQALRAGRGSGARFDGAGWVLNGLGLGIPWIADLYNVSVGLFFAYAGFFVRDGEAVRRIIEGLGVLMAVDATFIIFAPLLLGMPTLFWGPIEAILLAIGATSILAAKILRDVQMGGRVR